MNNESDAMRDNSVRSRHAPQMPYALACPFKHSVAPAQMHVHQRTCTYCSTPTGLSAATSRALPSGITSRAVAPPGGMCRMVRSSNSARMRPSAVATKRPTPGTTCCSTTSSLHACCGLLLQTFAGIAVVLLLLLAVLLLLPSPSLLPASARFTRTHALL